MSAVVCWQGDPPLPVLHGGAGRYVCADFAVVRTANQVRPWLVMGPDVWLHVKTLREARGVIGDRLIPYADRTPVTEL